MRKRIANARGRQHGAIAIIVALSLAVLIGFVGLALDLGKLYIAKTELQNSADACALAASRELAGTSSAKLNMAEAAGLTTGSFNRVMFQNELVTYKANNNVTFSQTINGSYKAKIDYSATEAAQMNFARCSVNRTGISNWFMQVLNVIPGVTIGDQTVSATAVAGLSPAQTNCALPVGLCSADIAGKPAGTWLEGAIGPSGGTSEGALTGNFKWVDFTPPTGGASELGGILKGTGVCNLPSVGTEVGQPGVITSLADEWNSRFGIYQGSTKPTDATPDFTGFAYTDAVDSWPSKFNAYSDYKNKKSLNTAYQGDAATGLKTNGTIKDAAYLAANGSDRRLGTAPVIDCSGFTSGSTAPVTSWACVLMLHPLNNGGGSSGTGATRMYLEYLGSSSDPASPCATLGLPGAPGSIGPLVSVLVQ